MELSEFLLAIPTRQKVKKRRAAMKELKRCSAAVHKQESLVRFTKTNDQKREENLNELKLRLNRQPKISDLFLTYENNESCETRRHESCYSAAAFMLAHSHINLQHQFAYKLIEDNNKREMIYARFFPPFFCCLQGGLLLSFNYFVAALPITSNHLRWCVNFFSEKPLRHNCPFILGLLLIKV